MGYHLTQTGISQSERKNVAILIVQTPHKKRRLFLASVFCLFTLFQNYNIFFIHLDHQNKISWYYFASKEQMVRKVIERARTTQKFHHSNNFEHKVIGFIESNSRKRLSKLISKRKHQFSVN